MRTVVQRVAHCSVSVGGAEFAAIGNGLLVLVGMKTGDTEESIGWMAEKIVNLRIFEDANAKMNLSILDNKGEIMVVSQFTLYGDARKGRRPEFTQAMSPDQAEKFYEQFVARLKGFGLIIHTGQFGAKMDIAMVNHGPVTLLLEHP